MLVVQLFWASSCTGWVYIGVETPVVVGISVVAYFIVGAVAVSFHTKVREFYSLGINPKIYLKDPTINTNPNN